MVEERPAHIRPSFAEREAAVAEVVKKTLAPRRPLCLRLLTPGRSDKPAWNVARKVEYLLTLPLRLAAALLTFPTLFGAVNRKLVWVAVAAMTFVPIAIWEIWVKTPWNKYQGALSHEYQIEALRKNPSGAGNPVESDDRAFWDTFAFFRHEAVTLPGALFTLRFGEWRRNFAKTIDAKVSEVTAMETMTPDRVAKEIKDDLRAAFAGVGPTKGTKPHRETLYERQMREDAERLHGKPASSSDENVYETSYQRRLRESREREQHQREESERLNRAKEPEKPF